jgi:hypothetical protein
MLLLAYLVYEKLTKFFFGWSSLLKREKKHNELSHHKNVCHMKFKLYVTNQ